MDEEHERIVAVTIGNARGEVQEVLGRIRTYVEDACRKLKADGVGFRYRQVDEGRIKELPSVVRAMNENNLSPEEIWKVDDIVGGRVVVYLLSDAQLLADLIAGDKQAPLIGVNVGERDDAGYKAIHVKGWYRASFGLVGCEIQIRTGMQDAFALISRDEFYGREEELPAFLVRMFQNQAPHVAALDDALDTISRETRRIASSEPIVQEAVGADERFEVTEEEMATKAKAQLPEEEAEAKVEAPEPPEDRLPRRTTDQTEDDILILERHVSAARKDAFLGDYLEERRRLSTLEELFRRVGAFDVGEASEEEFKAGFTSLLYKGPFVDGSRWVSYRPNQYAEAAERFLQRRFEEALREAANLEEETLRDAESVLAAADRLAASEPWSGYNRTLIVLTGSLYQDVLPDLYKKVTPEWELPVDMHLVWIVGAHDGVPILQIPDVEEAALYIVDLGRFASLRQLGKEPEFELEEFSEERARELVEQSPNIVRLHEGVDDTPEERQRQLRLFVGLKLYETLDLQVRDTGAVLGARIAATTV